MENKVFSLNNLIYPIKISVCFSMDYYELTDYFNTSKHYSQEDIEDALAISDMAVFLFDDHEDFHHIVLVVDDKNKIDTIVHECCHIVDMIYEHIGQERSIVCENYAYLVQFYFKEIYNLLKKHDKILCD